jgi:hypothetical protein
MANYLINCDDETTYIGCPQYIYYSFGDTVPPGHVSDCPDVGGCDGSCPEGGTCCNNASMSGYIYSDEFPSNLISSSTPKAKIYAGSLIDNNGSVGGVTFPPQTCESQTLAQLNVTTIVEPEIEGNKLKLPFTAQNSAAGGPYGLLSVFVMWYFSCE